MCLLGIVSYQHDDSEYHGIEMRHTYIRCVEQGFRESNYSNNCGTIAIDARLNKLHNEARNSHVQF